MNRQTKRRQILRYQDAQARIVDRQPALKRIDSKNRRLRRQAKYRLNICSGLEVTCNSAEYRLEIPCLKDLRWIRNRRRRKLLTVSKRVAGTGAKYRVEAPVIDNSDTLRPALLISDKINESCA